jgi:A/G-specific adenine glycosylase
MTAWERLMPLVHTFSHFKLAIQPCRVRIDQLLPVVEEDDCQVWATPRNMEKYGLPAPVKRLLGSLQSSC